MSLNLTTSSVASSDISIAQQSSVNLESYFGSSKFLKKIVPFALTTLVSRRVAINRAYLKHHVIANVPYIGFRHTLSPDHCARKLNGSRRIIQQMIEKKCLKSIHLYIQTVATKKIEETFDFCFSYSSDDDETARFSFNADAHQVAGDFFAQLNGFACHAKHNENDVNILCEFRFYDNISAEDLIKFPPYNVPNKPKTIIKTNAFLSTPYHKFDVRMNTRLEPAPRWYASERSKRSSDGNSSILSASKISKNNSDCLDVLMTGESVVRPFSGRPTSANSSVSSAFKSMMNDSQMLSMSLESVDEPSYKCGCGISLEINGVESIECHKCKHLQHVACIGYKVKNNIPNVEEYLCVKCCGNNNKLHDTRLTERCEDGQDKHLVCVIRLFLVCKKIHTPTFVLHYLSPDDSKQVEAYLKKKKLWDASIEKENTYFYDE